MKSKQKGSIITWIIILIISMIVLSSLIVSPLIAYNTDENIQFTIKNKERVTTGSGQNIQSKYLIYTDNGVYENTDTVWYWKWNSADVYNDIEIGKQCNARVYGFRIPFLSWFKNIISINCK